MPILPTLQRFFAKPAVLTAIKFLLLGIVLGWLYWMLSQNEHFNEEFIATLYTAFSTENLHMMLPLLLGIVLNWLLEAVKWKMLASKIEEISLWTSFKGVLAGLAMSVIITNNTGAYLGRVWSLQSASRYQVLGGMVLNSFSQNVVTHLLGYIGFYYWIYWKGWVSGPVAIGICTTVLMLSSTLVYIILRSVNLLEKLKRFDKIYPYLQVMQAYSMKEQLQMLGLSFIRYCIYAYQFGTVLLFFKVELPWPQFLSGISLVYLAKSSIPNFSFLTDLGIREFSALQFLGKNGFGVADAQIISATLTIWFINLVLPVAIGSFFLLKMKLTRNA
jgi:hypothetical protein